MHSKKSASRKCPASRCAKLVQPPDVFCRDHWDQFSEVLREAIQIAILSGKHNEAVILVTDGIRYLDNHRTPRRS